MQNFNEKVIIERVRLLRQQYAGSRGKSKFARTLGISASTYNYYENNRVPPIDILLKICEVTGADLQWLLAGQSAEKGGIRGMKKSISSSNAELLEKLDDLLTENPDLTDPILAFVELLCEKKDMENKLRTEMPQKSRISPDKMPSSQISTTQLNRQGWIPVLGRTAAGMVHFWDQTSLPEPQQAVTELDQLVKKHIGKEIVAAADGKVSVDLQARALLEGVKKVEANLIQVSGEGRGDIVEFVQCREVHQLFPDSFALQIDGDSMSPRINDGDIVILSPSVPAVQGHAAIARVANQIGVTCKLIRNAQAKVHLIPINEKYETKVVEEKDLLWALAVLCHISV